MADDPSHASSLEDLVERAQALLRSARAGDAAALARLRAVTRLKGMDDATLAASVEPTDVRHALAREHGQASWTALERHVEASQPIGVKAQRLLAVVREGDANATRRLLDQQPELARVDIFTACCAGDAEHVAAEIARDARVATQPHDTSGWTPLLHACASPLHADGPPDAPDVLRCVTLLLDAGADPNSFVACSNEGREARVTALHLACEQDNLAAAKLLLERGADPNDGESLPHAAERNRQECLELLLAHGADLSSRHPTYGNTPLYFLVGWHDEHVAAEAARNGLRWLLEHGADPNVTSKDDDETPLHAVARSGRDVAVAQLLLDHGANASARRRDGKTPLALAVRAGDVALAHLLQERGASDSEVAPADAFLGACMGGDEAAAKEALAAHPDLLASLSAEEREIVGHAAATGSADAVRMMATLGFDLAAESRWGGTPLHHAAWFGRLETVRTLIGLGAPVNVRDHRFGSSPLAWAAHGSHHCRRADDEYRAVVGALLDAGSDREASINRWGEPPESMASRRVAALLRERGFAP